MSANNENDKKIQDLKDSEWWQAGEEDQYNFETKLLCTGCRPLKRDYIKCIHENSINYNLQKCANLKTKYMECDNL